MELFHRFVYAGGFAPYLAWDSQLASSAQIVRTIYTIEWYQNSVPKI